MIRQLKKRAKVLLNYVPSAGDGNFKTFRYFFSVFTVCLTPEGARAVMVRQHKIFEKGMVMRELLEAVMGRTLFTLNGKEWKARRTMFNEWYKDDVIQNALETYEKKLKEGVANWHDGQHINFAAWNRDLVTGAFCESLLGITRDSAAELHKYRTIEDLFFIRMIARLFHIYGLKRIVFLRQMSSLRAAASKIVDRAPLPPDGSEKKYLHLLQESVRNGSITRDEAISEVMSNYSSSLTTAYTLSALAHHLAEHRDVIDVSALDDEKIESLCMESMRLSPVIYVLFRQAAEDTTLDGCPVKKGRHILLPIETMQRNEQHWDRAEEFCPYRFAGASKAGINEKAWLPFGAGPRQCPGKNLAMSVMKVFIRETIMKGITFEPGQIWPPVYDRGLVKEPKNNELWLTVRRAS